MACHAKNLFYERYRNNERALTYSVSKDNRLDILTLKSQIRQVDTLEYKGSWQKCLPSLFQSFFSSPG